MPVPRVPEDDYFWTPVSAVAVGFPEPEEESMQLELDSNVSPAAVLFQGIFKSRASSTDTEDSMVGSQQSP